jgi:hypothetical protein
MLSGKLIREAEGVSLAKGMKAHYLHFISVKEVYIGLEGRDRWRKEKAEEMGKEDAQRGRSECKARMSVDKLCVA